VKGQKKGTRLRLWLRPGKERHKGRKQKKGMPCVAVGEEGKGNKKMNIERLTSNVQ